MGHQPSVTVTKFASLPAFSAEGYSGSQAPCVRKIMADRFVEIWFSTRDGLNRSFPAYVVFDMKEKQVIDGGLVYATLGPPGTFNDSGIMVSQFYKDTLWFVGWNKGPDDGVRYRTSIGSAEVNKQRIVRQTLEFDRSRHEPIGVSMPFFSSGVMYYMSYRSWDLEGKKYEPAYDIKRAFSDDLAAGILRGTSLEATREEAHARPYFDERSKHLWYCSRKLINYRDRAEFSYKIKLKQGGTLISSDWKVHMPEGDVMAAYPHLFSCGDSTYILYNNGFTSEIQIGSVVYE